MNKLLVSGIINLDKGVYNLEFNTEEAIINIKKDVTIYLANSNLKKLEINIEDNSTLNVYKFDHEIKNNIDIIINENKDTCVNFNYTFINNKDITVHIANYINSSNNKSNIVVRNVSNSGYSKIVVDAYIKENTFNNTALEDLKGLVNGGFIHIEPNIMCSTNEVVANHLTTIGTFDNKTLDYLMSKGISLDNAKKLLLQGFILTNMDKNMTYLLGGD